MIWHISLPVWGDRYLNVFQNATWPALKIALQNLGQPATLFVHTTDDGIDRLRPLFGGYQVRFLQVPGPDRSFGSLTEAHNQVVRSSPEGVRVSLLTADLVLSANALASCETLFHKGKLAIAVAGMRACEEEPPRPGMTGRELLSWGWEHRHPMTAESTWPDGHSYDVWRMYFEQGDEVVCRLCLPHPLAFVRLNDRPYYINPTCDVSLLNSYGPGETHLVTDPDEAAMIELSPKEKEFMWTETMKWRYDTGGPSLPPFWGITSQRHRLFFQQKIIIKGTGGEVGDASVVQKLLG